VNVVKTDLGNVGVRNYPYEDPNYSLNGFPEMARPDDLTGLTAFGLMGRLGIGGMGSQISPESAVNGTISVHAAVALLAEVISSLPLNLYERLSANEHQLIETFATDRSKPGVGYPGSLARVLGELPNPETTAQEMWEGIVWHAALYGAGYAQVIRDGSGRPSQLWPLYPNRIQAKRVYSQELATRLGSTVGARYFIYNKGSSVIYLLDEEVLVVPWVGSDALNPRSPISPARVSIASDQAAQRFQSSFFENSATPSSIVTIPKGRPMEFTGRAEQVHQKLEGLHRGPTRAGRMAVVEEGVTWTAMQMNMVDMQWIESRKYSVVEMARLFRIPPHLLGDVERTTSWGTGIEEQNLAFLSLTLRPIIQKIENAINRDLGLVPGVKTLRDERLYAQFDAENLLRTNIKDRYTAYGVAMQWGFMTPNAIQAKENLPLTPDGDKPWMPVNYMMQGGDTPTDPAMQLASALMALANREQEPPQLTVNNNPPNFQVDVTPVAEMIERGQTHIAKAIEGLADSREIHVEVDATPVAEALDRATEETRAVQTELFAELARPRKLTPSRDQEGYIVDVLSEVMDESLTDGKGSKR
jgi:HK97 family phage portal protein